MDIKSLYTLDAHTKGAECRLKSPIDGKLTDCYITVSGLDSVAWRTAEIDGKRQVLLINADDELSDEEKKAKTIAVTASVLAKASIAWRGFGDGGKELKFSKKRVEELYLNSPKIADQVDHFIARRGNFTKG